jgi:hypothetical protein
MVANTAVVNMEGFQQIMWLKLESSDTGCGNLRETI